MAAVTEKPVAPPAVARRAAGAALGVASVTLASRVLGFAREAALAAVFGASRASDAYLVATVIPGFLVMALNNALVAVGIPVLSEYLHRPERRPRLEALVWSSFHAVALGLASACLAALTHGGAAEALALALYLGLAFLLAGTVYAAACRALKVREMALVWESARGVLAGLRRDHRPAA